MPAPNLQARVTALFDSLKQTQQLTIRLSKLSLSPGTTSSNPEEENPRIELSAEIHQSLKEQEEDFELLRQEVEDQANTQYWKRRDSEREREKSDLATSVTRLGEDLKIARAQFRRAQLTAKRNADLAKRKERELLFSSIQDDKSPSPSTATSRRKGQEKLSQDELLTNASGDVTAALRRTHNLMTAELERSGFAHETLENSTKELKGLEEKYSGIDSLLSASRGLVGTLISSQKSDTWYLESAFFILCITIGWLVFRRLLYGPGWWLVYLPTKLLYRLAVYFVQILIGTLSFAAGAIGARNQSLGLSQSSASLAQKPTGTGAIPRFLAGHKPPMIRVGGGGQGAKMPSPGEATQGQHGQREQEGEKSMSDKIGEMAEESREKGSGEQEAQQSTVLRERTEEDGPSNPKKRMWEEPIGRGQEGRQRDEL